jgi:hypothetical protein
MKLKASKDLNAKVSSYMLQQSLSYMQLDKKFDQVVTCIPSTQTLFYEERGFKPVQYLGYYEQNKKK